jgi:disulfide bond formation protein DsbB
MNDPDLLFAWAGAILAGLTVLGSLYMSIGMGLAACPLCYYQRTFVMGAFAVLLIGASFGLAKAVCLPALVLPMAMGGLSVAAQHVWLEMSGKMECPKGAFNLGTAPQQSLTALGLLTALLVTGSLWTELPGNGWGPVAAGAGLGVALAIACLQSASPPPKPAPETYKEKPLTCRPLPAPE